MLLTGTEAEVVNIITRLNGASKSEINKETGLSLDYIGYLCRFLTRKGYLVFGSGRYYLVGAGGENRPVEEPTGGKSLAREIADEVVRRIGLSRGSRLPEEEAIRIKTDFEIPIRDESVTLESNLDRVGAKSEREKFDIDNLIESLTRVRKGGR